VPALLERLGVERPIVQAGMGGGIATHELAAAVSEAGGLGTLGIADPRTLRQELGAARRLTGRPIAVNLLLPFARSSHWAVADEADAVVTFWGRPRRRSEGAWLHQCGSVEEALEARAEGADGVIVQGIEAGGHVRGHWPALELLAQARAALGSEFPVLVAGGIATAADVEKALAAGADAAVLGTRFVMSEESGAHDGYKRRLAAASHTHLTELFGSGWPAPHRVVPNAATDRWLGRDERGPSLVRAANRAAAPFLARLPSSVALRLAAAQRSSVPLFGPAPPSRGAPEAMLDAAPLYAGETVARIDDVRPAAEVVAGLAGGH
jgi:NAD(P)H-dependent flavin oxidoreductase YrpB (nitropropane dioxygenase family)